MRWLWIDRFTHFESGKSARAVKSLSLAEDFFADHFPEYPVMPAALILEGMAQTGGILVGQANEFLEKVVLAKIAKGVFHREALAGEVLTYVADIQNLRPEGASVFVRAYAGDEELIAEAEIFFAHLGQTRSQQIFGEQNFVFSGEFRQLFLRGLALMNPQKEGRQTERSGENTA